MIKQSKWHNKTVEWNGIVFDSVKERDRYIYLLHEQRIGHITELQRQVQFTLIPDEYKEYVEHGKRKDKIKRVKLFTGVKYIADFTYKRSNGEYVVSDVKSSRDKRAVDKVFFLKEKMMHSLLKIDIYKVYEATAPV